MTAGGGKVQKLMLHGIWNANRVNVEECWDGTKEIYQWSGGRDRQGVPSQTRTEWWRNVPLDTAASQLKRFPL